MLSNKLLTCHSQGLPEYTPPPFEQAFGMLEVSQDAELTVKSIGITGKVLFAKQLEPE